MEFDGALFRAGTLEDRFARSIVDQGRVWRILYNQDVVLLCKSDQLVVEFVGRHRARRVVWIIDVKQLATIRQCRINFYEIRKKSVFFKKRDIDHLPAEVSSMRGHHRIARHGLKDRIAGIHERERKHGQRGLGPNAVVDFSFRIKLHTKEAFHVL